VSRPEQDKRKARGRGIATQKKKEEKNKAKVGQEDGWESNGVGLLEHTFLACWVLCSTLLFVVNLNLIMDLHTCRCVCVCKRKKANIKIESIITTVIISSFFFAESIANVAVLVTRL